ncbi:MAG: hypothetical protein JXO72_14220 [Vicinamibacteria bacterium]|nr:hypothetical protein [Vicinamibacteria bacterium]
MKDKILAAIPLHVSGLLSTIAALWGFAFVFLIASQWELVQNADDFAPAIFFVEKAVYVEANPSPDGTDSPSCHAEGTVDGHRERLTLYPCTSQADLDRRYSAGQQIRVLFNPSPALTRWLVQKEYMRVVPYSSDLREQRRRILRQALVLGYLPVTFCLPLALVFTVRARPLSYGRERTLDAEAIAEVLRSRPIGWIYVVLSLVFLAVQAVIFLGLRMFMKA